VENTTASNCTTSDLVEKLKDQLNHINTVENDSLCESVLAAMAEFEKAMIDHKFYRTDPDILKSIITWISELFEINEDKWLGNSQLKWYFDQLNEIYSGSKTMKRTIIYLRSANSGRQNHQLTRQLELCQGYATQQADLQVVEVIRDTGSGMSQAYHSGLTLLLSMIQRKEIDVVLVADLSRISRNPDKLNSFLQGCKNAGVEVVDATGQPITASPQTIIASMFGYMELDKQLARMAKGRELARKARKVAIG
jgi:predicted site-specific integrase-resolvase